ncbi:uncharacterized protein At5g43822-like isoform X1 [Physcomitrium patens]|uniref:uncharacterized protein At5g43822-like isoform X1 n=1 Tax=Physcomitrium patens TaxID=3218 RepID=UPI000D1652A9|nr:uncharacterized protein At5g43822-like isoform X1 [Physcomitrium patens]|eukprot:XP_024357247.1 uncharacterized protein At5g43822-like isoform X1 [Physcomitrella patens]
MERLVKKFEQRYRRALDHHNTWEELQSRLLKQFSNASAILERLPVLLESKNYGILENVKSIAQALPAVQIEQLELILRSMHSTLLRADLEKIVKSFEKLWRDGIGLLKAEKITAQQSEQRVGSRPSLNDCLKGLHDLYLMHRDEHKLKLAIISSLSYESRSDDISALQVLLLDQPNLPPDEVKHIFEVIAAGDVW